MSLIDPFYEILKQLIGRFFVPFLLLLIVKLQEGT